MFFGFTSKTCAMVVNKFLISSFNFQFRVNKGGADWRSVPDVHSQDPGTQLPNGPAQLIAGGCLEKGLSIS